MRAWVSAAERGRCPPRMLHRGFAAVNAAGALPDFHLAMALLGGEAVETLILAPMPCPQISEDEAILLGLWRAISLESIANAHATLALRSAEHTSELQPLMRIAFAVFRLQTTQQL